MGGVPWLKGRRVLDLFDDSDIDIELPVLRVLMSLNLEFYQLILAGQKFHEFRKRYATKDQRSQWFVYLTAPEARLAPVIDLDVPIVDTPDRIAAIAEHGRAGNGASVADYLADRAEGTALPLRHVREYEGFTGEQLAVELGSWHPPQGYILIDQHPDLAAVCDRLITGQIVRELPVRPPAPIS